VNINNTGVFKVDLSKGKMKYKGIIFDLDGTLADTLADIAGSMNRVLKNHGYPVHPVNDYKLLVGRGLDNLVKQALPANERLPENVIQCLAEMIQDYNINCLNDTHLYPGIREMLDSLIVSGVKLSVFSNKTEPLTIKIVEKLMGDIPFMKVMGARPDFPKKPDPAGAVLISSLMEIPPAAIIYVGDSDVDMITANKAGMFAVGVSWGFRNRRELTENGARLILDSPLQLVDCLL
jgi:phosphoglycolate phosphatase